MIVNVSIDHARTAVLDAIDKALERHITAKMDAAFNRDSQAYKVEDRAIALLERERKWTEKPLGKGR